MSAVFEAAYSTAQMVVKKKKKSHPPSLKLSEACLDNLSEYHRADTACEEQGVSGRVKEKLDVLSLK